MSERGRATPQDASSGDSSLADQGPPAATRESLSSAQHAELLRRLRGDRRRQTIPPTDRSLPLPLSFPQERIWLHEQLVPGSVVYCRPTNIRLRGPLQTEPLRQALRDIVARHDSLRTNVRWVEDTPRLSVQTQAVVQMPFTDLSAAPAPEQTARQLAQEEIQHPFDLQAGPLLRCRLLQVGREDHLLLLTFHHFAFDAWSQGVLLEELASSYAAYAAKGEATVRTLAIQYADFAAWDRSGPRLAALAEGRSYWRRELADPPALQLQTDFPRTSERSELAGQVDFELPEDLLNRLRELVRCQESTLFSLLLAALAATLHRHTGAQDMVVGCPVAGRSRVETESLIGVFINTLPLRINVSSAETFRELAQRVHESVLRGLQHQDVPLQAIVQDVLTERHSDSSPLFQLMFNYERSSVQSRDAAGVTFEPQDDGPAATLVDLLLELTESPTRISGRFVYRRDLWEQTTIARLAEHYLTLLAGIVVVPDEKVSALPLLTDAERRLVVETWNQTRRDYPQLSVSRLFEQQAARRPEAVAATCGAARLTYAELNLQANRLARHLQRCGVNREDCVGISVNRSFDMLVGLLAILKAGGAYVPLNPHYPDERLSLIAADAGTKFILTQRQFATRWRACDAQVLLLDDEQSAWLGEADDNLPEAVSPESLAYVIYTSGSTGVPKGVEVLHRGIVRLLCGVDYVRLDETQSVLQLATLSFDASTFEIWAPLLHGGRCVLAPSDLPDLQDLERLIRQEQVRTLWLTSTLFNAIVDENVAVLKGVEQLLIGGEALSVSHVRRAQQALGSRTQIINGYGPTECTTFACCDRLPVEVGDSIRSIPIGRPIANTTAYVLDAQGRPSPIGVPGELHLGGDGLARGYLNQPELTAARFVKSPFSDDVNSRLYRTGDLCRWLPDGRLEFLGRIDNQVKLRGFRIEPGEIENALLRHPPVSQAIVVLREDTPGNKQLVAYCVPNSSQPPLAVDDLKRLLHHRLPDYMVPSTFVLLQALPRNANGKIDKQALPPPPEVGGEHHVAADSRETPEEQLIAGIWRHVLGRDRVGLHENFFNLGGHSLSAIRMIDNVNRQASGQLKVADVFVHPTVSQLARKLVESRQARAVPPGGRYLELIRPGHGPSTIVGVGTNLHVLVNRLPEQAPIWWLKLDGTHVWPHRDLSISAQAEIDIAELEAANIAGKMIFFGFSFGGLLALEIARQLIRRGRRDICVVLLEPPLPGNQQPRLAKKVSRHLQVLRKPQLTSRVSYVTTRLRNVLVARWHTWQSRWQRFRGVNIPAEQRWSYIEPLLIQQIRAYAPTESLPLDVHLIGRPEYLAANIAPWQRIIGGQVIAHAMPAGLSHQEVAKMEHSRTWADAIRQLINPPPGTSPQNGTGILQSSDCRDGVLRSDAKLPAESA